MPRLELDRSRRETQMALASPNRLHGAIESGFPGERQRRLWRLDELQGRLFLLLVSDEAPDLSAVRAQFSPPGATWETRDYGAFLERIGNGSKWRFRLGANPTISAPRAEAQRGKILAHVTAAQQKQWLLDRAEKHGFRLTEESFEVVKRGFLSFAKGKERRKVTLGICTFEGSLEVTDADRFREALTRGVGRGKAYGLGLMTVAGASVTKGEHAHE